MNDKMNEQSKQGQSVTGESTGSQSSGRQSSVEGTFREQSSAERPFGEGMSGEQSSGNESSGERKQEYSQDTKADRSGSADGEISEKNISRNNDTDFLRKSENEGRSQSMNSENAKDRSMGNDVEKMHTEGDEPDLKQVKWQESSQHKSADDGSRMGAMSSETGKGEMPYYGPFKEGPSQNTPYGQEQSRENKDWEKSESRH